MWTHNDVVARYVFFLRTEIYYYSLLVSIKKFSPLLDWDSPISRWRARAFPSSPSLSLPLLHTLFLSLSLPIVIFYLNRILTLPSRCSVMWFYFLSVRRFFLFASFRSNDSTSFPLSFSLSLPHFVCTTQRTHIYIIYIIYMYIYTSLYTYFLYIHKQSLLLFRLASLLSWALFSLYFSARLLFVRFFFFLLFFACVYMYL